MEYKCAFCGHTSKTRCGHHELQAEVGTLIEDNRLLKLQVSELQKKLAQIHSAICLNCKGSGEFGLADGEVPCWVCGGSGDPTKPGVFAEKQKDVIDNGPSGITDTISFSAKPKGEA